MRNCAHMFCDRFGIFQMILQVKHPTRTKPASNINLNIRHLTGMEKKMGGFFFLILFTGMSNLKAHIHKPDRLKCVHANSSAVYLFSIRVGFPIMCNGG